MSDVNNPERDAGTAQTLNGGWFRREREWVAVGRKQLALRLGVTEYQLLTMERRKQDVPPEWLGVLAELGFRIPQEVADQIPKVSAPPPEMAVAESVASIPFADSVCPAENSVREGSVSSVSEVPPIEVAEESASVPSAVPSAPAFAEPMDHAGTLSVEVDPCLDARVTEESEPADSDIATSADAQTTEREHRQESQRGTKWTPFNGRWLREQRQKKGIRRADVVKRLGTWPTELNAIERLNIPLPLAWIPGLLKLGALTVAESRAARQLPHGKSSTKNGMWLRLQRGQCGLTHANVAAWLGVSHSDVKLVEARQWPLPVEWLRTLEELFAPRRGKRKKHTTPKKDSAPQNDSAPRQNAPQASARVAAAAIPAPAPKSAPSQPARELTETIVNYRLMLGERSGLSAVEVLAQITADLQFSLAKDALSYDQLRAAMNLIMGR